ncbi:major capsid family protein [Yersinia pseudotuberculosis]|uniref:major capsid family protein n=1 Tax=Yersinia pseudotuberculosis TaxID=633 RepID=UPI0038B5F9E4
MKQSVTHSSLAPRNVRPLSLTAKDITGNAHLDLGRLGINISRGTISNMISSMGLDSNDTGLAPSPLPGLMPGGSPTPIQFLQAWLPGFVRMITAARKIDELIGIATVGAWEDEEIVQGMLEPIGSAAIYSDHGNIPLASWQVGYARRSIVRFEQGFSVGALEEARTAKASLATAAEKRSSAAQSLDVSRNRVGFYGYNDGANMTYGFLNEPNLLPALTAAPGAGGDTTWQSKTFLEITADIRRILVELQVASMDTIDPEAMPITIALPTGVNQYLSVTSSYGNSVRQWVKENYPNLRFVTAPEMKDAVGGESVTYAYPDSVNDGSSDDGQVWSQNVPSKFTVIGVEKRSKVYVEDFSNATAGVLLKRPYLVIRLIGI